MLQVLLSVQRLLLGERIGVTGAVMTIETIVLSSDATARERTTGVARSGIAQNAEKGVEKGRDKRIHRATHDVTRNGRNVTMSHVMMTEMNGVSHARRKGETPVRMIVTMTHVQRAMLRNTKLL